MKAKVLFFQNKAGGVAFKVNLYNTNGFKYQKGKRKFIRMNQGEDYCEYPLIVSFGEIDNFLSVNGIKDAEVEVDQNSLDAFYGYNGYGHEKYVAKLTPGFVNEWWNQDCPNLYRYTANKSNGKSILVQRLLYFTNCLVESTWYGAYVDDTITEEEVTALAKGREQTTIYKEMMNVLAANKVTAEQVAEYQGYVDEYEARIQSIIDNNKAAIKAHLFSNNMLFDESGRERSFGLDCGFLNVFTEDRDYVEKKGILKNVKRTSAWLRLNLPYNTQSLTVMENQFQIIKEIVSTEAGEALFCKTVLD